MSRAITSSLRHLSRSATISTVRGQHNVSRRFGPAILQSHARPFSLTAHRRLMETSGFSEEQLTVRDAILKICSNFDDDYWMEHDQTETYPHELHAALAKDGWIGIALPEDLGGAGLGIAEATMMMQSIAESGAGLAGAQSIHANVYATQPVSKFATPEQRGRFLTKIISGEWRTCFGVTEPNTGLETLKLTTTAKKESDGYSVTGQKIWISSAQVATKMVLLARTTPIEEVTKPSEGLSMFYVDFDLSQPGLEAKRIKNFMAALANGGGGGDVAVVLVPLPAHGHLNQFLLLASHLSHPNISLHYSGIAALNRQARHRLQSSPPSVAAIHFHDLPVRPFPTPPPDPTSTVAFPTHLQPLFDATFDMELPLAALLRSLSASYRRVVVIHDSSLSFIAGLASSMRVVAFAFNTVSAFASLFYSWEARGKLPLDLNNGGGGLSFDGCFSEEFAEFLRRQRRLRECSAGHLLNTCRAIEGRFLDLLADEPGWKGRLNFAIGPLNPVQLNPSGHTCMEWLDRQPANSVIYVSFGTLSSLPDEQVRQLANGLAASWQRFIWVVRHADRGNTCDAEMGPELPEGYERMVEGRGVVVRGWAPQMEILAHGAVGGFLSHCGWNSCMEAMSMGVPMLTWPMHSDQPRNAVLVTEVLGVGMTVREWMRRGKVVSGDVIKKCVIKLMEGEEGKDVRGRARKVGEAIQEAGTEGGTSKSELELFIGHITSPS